MSYFGAGGANPLSAMGAGGAAGDTDLMTKVLAILRRTNLGNPNAGMAGMTLNDIQKIMQMLKEIGQKMGPGAVGGVLKQFPGLTNALQQSNALGSTGAI